MGRLARQKSAAKDGCRRMGIPDDELFLPIRLEGPNVGGGSSESLP